MPDVLADMKQIRGSRRSAAMMDYRRTVVVIAAGGADPTEFGGLDAIMERLKINDTELATDVDVLRDLEGYRQRVNDFDANRSEHDKLLKKAEAKLAKLREEHRTFRHRQDEAEQAAREAGRPFVRARKARDRIDKLERNNPRLFGSQDTILPGFTGAEWGDDNDR